MSDLPLAGVRVLAVEQYGAGPFGTMFLADLAADVVKIENPVGGDFARDIGPYWFGDGSSEFFHAYNRNNPSITVDLTTPEGKAVFLDLVRNAADDLWRGIGLGDGPGKTLYREQVEWVGSGDFHGINA